MSSKRLTKPICSIPVIDDLAETLHGCRVPKQAGFTSETGPSVKNNLSTNQLSQVVGLYVVRKGTIMVAPIPKLIIRFPLGNTCATPGALEALERSGRSGRELLARHQAGDWGEVCSEDAQANDRAVQEGERILSAYRLKNGVKLWVITEADRSTTTILLPYEY
jgi:hypothetical protein